MLSILDIRARIAAGTLTPQGAIDLCREAIADRDPGIGAFVTIDPDPAIPEEGPLAGIAVGVKDIIDTAAMPTQMGSAIYEGWQPRADAAVVTRLKGLGAVPLAKTTTTAFASSDPTATRNPHDPGHSPGGSSAGSAAAVGGGMLPLALGTQTAGSVIRPASYCGCAAIKPSFRLIPTVGVKTYSWALDTLGLFAAGVGDLAYALAAVTGREGIEGATCESPRIAVVRLEIAEAPSAEAEAALARAVAAAERAGARLSDLTLPPELDAAWERHRFIQDFEGRHALGWEYATHREALPPLVRAHLEAGDAIAPADYDDARRHAHRARRVLKGLFDDFDAILTFPAPGPAPATLASTGDPRFNRLWTLMGVPCVNVPVPGDGLPVGVQVIGRFGGDGHVLAVAGMIEKALR